MRKNSYALDQSHDAHTLMSWEQVLDTPEARKTMKGWVYGVDEGPDYNGGSPSHADPFYFIEVRLPAGRFDALRKEHLIRDFTRIILLAENKPFVPEEAERAWVTIVDLEPDRRATVPTYCSLAGVFFRVCA
jgi:hypothetical protein